MAGKLLREMRFWAPLDNHEPHRAEAVGIAEVWAHPDGHEVICIPEAEGTFKDAYRSLYLLDDGASVVAYYVAGYNPTDRPGVVFLHPLPTNPDGRTRPDNGRVVDYDTWALGPRRAYHLKVRPE